MTDAYVLGVVRTPFARYDSSLSCIRALIGVAASVREIATVGVRHAIASRNSQGTGEGRLWDVAVMCR